jgi:hypothetical protein
MATLGAHSARLSVFVMIAITTHSGASLAADPALQVVGETSLGYLDSEQRPPPDGGPGSVTSRGVVWMIAPGLNLAFASQRTVQRVGYRFQQDFLFGENFTQTSTNTLDYLGFFDLSQRVGLVLDARILESNQNSPLTFAPTGSDFPGPIPLGDGAFLRGAAGETFLFDVARDWRAWQGGTIMAETPILGAEGPRTLSPGARLGIERLFLTDAVGVEGRSTYTIIEDGVRLDGSVAPQQRQLVNVGVGRWRHDWGRDFASRVEAGVLRLDRLNTGTGFWEPTGTAALAYVTPYGDAELSYSHGVTTDPVLGQTMVSDDVRLRGGLPLTTDGRFVVAMTAGYQHGRLLDENVNRAADVDTVMGDVSLGWQVTRPVLLSVRYQHVNQWSDIALPGLPLRFVQNLAMLGATIELPPDVDMPRAYRAPRRVDATDEIRDTVQPPRDDVRPETP